MIVARLLNNRRQTQVPGSVRLEGYDDWFPLTDASFSFAFGSDAKKSDQLGIAKTNSTKEEIKAAGITAASKKSGENSVSCTKLVDMASPYLMSLSVMNRLKGNKPKADLIAEIHFVETAIPGVGSPEPKSSVNTFMMVSLGDVIIDSWSLNASGDDRPGESFSLKFQKFALQYAGFQVKESKGSRKREAGDATARKSMKGFDQVEQTDWTPDNWKGT